MNPGGVYWDRELGHFMIPDGNGLRPADHKEIKAVLDAALAGWRDLLDAMAQGLEQEPQ